jgi:hypothetical protein
VLTVPIPLNLFAVGFGLSGLAETRRTAAAAGSVPYWIGDGILAFAAAVWVATLDLYLAWAARHRDHARADLVGPVTAPLASLAVITPLVLAAQGIMPRAHTVGVVVTTSSSPRSSSTGRGSPASSSTATTTSTSSTRDISCRPSPGVSSPRLRPPRPGSTASVRLCSVTESSAGSFPAR